MFFGPGSFSSAIQTQTRNQTFILLYFFKGHIVLEDSAEVIELLIATGLLSVSCSSQYMKLVNMCYILRQ